jgi:hypothetical protein
MEKILVYNESLFEYVLSKGSINDVVAFLVLLHRDKLAEKMLPNYAPTWNLGRTISQIYEEDIKQLPTPYDNINVGVEEYIEQQEKEKEKLEKWWLDNGGKKSKYRAFYAKLNRFKKSLIRSIMKVCRENNTNNIFEINVKNSIREIVENNLGLLI